MSNSLIHRQNYNSYEDNYVAFQHLINGLTPQFG